ncbi:MAG: hypothetical protein Kow009_08210 [Spirochaetales bacterium]
MEQRTDAANEALSDILAACGFLLFAVLMGIGASQFSYKSNMGFVTSAAFTPILLSVLVSLLSIFLILETRKRNRTLPLSLAEWFKSIRDDETVRRFGILALLIGLYIGLVGIVNFFILTFGFLFCIYSYLQVGKLWRVLLYSVLNTLLIAYVIPTIYQMPLP